MKYPKVGILYLLNLSSGHLFCIILYSFSRKNIHRLTQISWPWQLTALIQDLVNTDGQIAMKCIRHLKQLDKEWNFKNSAQNKNKSWQSIKILVTCMTQHRNSSPGIRDKKQIESWSREKMKRIGIFSILVYIVSAESLIKLDKLQEYVRRLDKENLKTVSPRDRCPSISTYGPLACWPRGLASVNHRKTFPWIEPVDWTNNLRIPMGHEVH